MSSRLFCAGLGLAALLACLGGPARTTAKPPDLPLVVEDEYVTPPAAKKPEPREPNGGVIIPAPLGEFPDLEPTLEVDLSEEVTDPAGPQPDEEQCQAAAPRQVVTTCRKARPRLSVRARRNLAACLLFTIHPLLGLTPTDGLVDMPEDHPFSGNVQVQVKECETGSDLFGGQRLTNLPCGMTGCIVISEQDCPVARCLGRIFTFNSLLCPKAWLECMKKVARQERVNHLIEWVKVVEQLLKQANQPGQVPYHGFVDVEGSCDSSPVVEESAQKAEQYCPWMRQQMRKCQQSAVVDPEEMPDVLTNLQNLIDAEDLLKVAEKLRDCGQMTEALACYEMASKLCPGSRVDEAANQARNELAVCVPPAAEPVCPATAVPGEPVAVSTTLTVIKKNTDWKAELKQRLQTPIYLNYSETPLTQVLDDLRAWEGINIVVDHPALKKAEIDPATPITIKVEQVSLQSALKLVLRQAELKYVYKDEVLLVVPKTKPGYQGATKGFYWVPKAKPSVCCSAPKASVHACELLKACRLAVESGCYHKAVKLVKAACAIDPLRVSADPLVYKMNLVGCPAAACIGSAVGTLAGRLRQDVRHQRRAECCSGGLCLHGREVLLLSGEGLL